MKEIRIPAALAAALAGSLAASLAGAPAASAQNAAARSASPTPNAPAAKSATQYEDASSNRNFVIDQRGNQAIVKFQDTSEVMVLQAVPAQRGDTFLRNDEGQVLFRKTEQGNMVSYVDNKNGAPAAMIGPVAPLSAPPMAASLDELRSNTALRLSKIAGHVVTVFGTAEFANSETLAADALGQVVAGVQSANAASRGAAKLNAVRVVRAAFPTVVFKDGELVLGVNPASGAAGRPSADAVSEALVR